MSSGDCAIKKDLYLAAAAPFRWMHFLRLSLAMAKREHCSTFAKVSLLVEATLVTVATIWIVAALPDALNQHAGWFIIPFLFIAGAVIPTTVRKRSFAQLGFRLGPFGSTLRVLCWTCLVVFLSLFCGLLMLKCLKVQPPLCPVVPEQAQYSWLVYQFMYVAVSEEVFFRGYLQSNVMRLLAMAGKTEPGCLPFAAITISAAVFALSHAVLQRSAASTIVFFPGLIFGWLYCETKSLLAPILFHGLANVCYGFMAVSLNQALTVQ